MSLEVRYPSRMGVLKEIGLNLYAAWYGCARKRNNHEHGPPEPKVGEVTSAILVSFATNDLPVRVCEVWRRYRDVSIATGPMSQALAIAQSEQGSHFTSIPGSSTHIWTSGICTKYALSSGNLFAFVSTLCHRPRDRLPCMIGAVGQDLMASSG